MCPRRGAPCLSRRPVARPSDGSRHLGRAQDLPENSSWKLLRGIFQLESKGSETMRQEFEAMQLLLKIAAGPCSSLSLESGRAHCARTSDGEFPPSLSD